MQPTASGPGARLQALYHVNSGTRLVVDLRMNGQPSVQIESHAILMDITPFVVDGHNAGSLRIELLETAGGVDPRLLVDDIAISRMTEEGSTVLASAGACQFDDSDVCELDFEFEASVPLRWRWQDADGITALTAADRQSMLSLLEARYQLYRQHDVKALRRLDTPWQKEGGFPVPPIWQVEPDVVWDGVQRYLDANSPTVSRAANDDIAFTKGTKLVRLHAPGCHDIGWGPQGTLLLTLTTPSGDVDFPPEEGGDMNLFFLKELGEWKLLDPEWRY